MFAEDLSPFFDLDGHAVSAAYNGGPGTLDVIFDREYLEPLTGVAGSNPTALVQTSALPAGHVGKTLGFGAAAPAWLASTTWKIVGAELIDDGALTRLQLVSA
jgi:hypothetical protein